MADSSTAGLLAGAVRLRRLPATAEALAAVGVASAVIDLVAGRSLGVPGVSDLSARSYWTIGWLVLTVVLSVVVHRRRDLVSPSVGATFGVFATLTAATDMSKVDQAALLGTVAVAVALLIVRFVPRLPVHRTATRTTALVAGAVFAAEGVLSSLLAASDSGWGAWCGAGLAALVAGAPEITGRDWPRTLRRLAAGGAGALISGLLLAADLVPADDRSLAVAAVTAVVIALVVAVDGVAEPLDRVASGVLVAAGVTAAVAQGNLQADAVDGHGLRAAGAGLALLAGVAVVVAVRYAVAALPAAAAATVLGLAAVGEMAGADGANPAATAVALVGGAVVVLALLARRLPVPVDVVRIGDVVAAIAFGGSAAAASALADAPQTAAQVTAVLAGLSLLAALALPASEWVTRAAAVVAATIYASVAVGLTLHLHDVTAPEWYVATPAVTWLALGAALMRRPAAIGSWVLAPGLLVGVLPTLSLALDGDVPRQIALLVVGAVLVALGAQQRLAAPLYVGAALVAVVVVRIVGPHVVALPRWVTLGTLGVVLLVLGATWERRLRDLRHAADELRPRIAALR